MESYRSTEHTPTLLFWVEVYKFPKKWVLIRRTEKELLSPSDTITVNGPFCTAEEAHQWAQKNVPSEFILCSNDKQILTKSDRLKIAGIFEENQNNRRNTGEIQGSLIFSLSTTSVWMIPAGLFAVCVLSLIGYVGAQINAPISERPQASSSIEQSQPSSPGEVDTTSRILKSDKKSLTYSALNDLEGAIRQANFVCRDATEGSLMGEANVGYQFRVVCDNFLHVYKVTVAPNGAVYVQSW